MIHGNVEGIRDTILKRLDEIYDIKGEKDTIVSEEIINVIVDVTNIISREISVAIDRRGTVVSIAIGDSSSVELPLINVKEKRLSGVRVIHTHPSGNSNLSAVDISALLKMKLDAMVAVGVSEETLTDISIGFCNVKDNILTYEKIGPLSAEDALNFNLKEKVSDVSELLKQSQIVEDDEEKAILVGIGDEESLDELAELAKACNVTVIDRVLQKRSKVDTAFFIGSGKAEEIALLRQIHNANVIIFDDELLGSQVRNLEEAIGAKVIDRTTLILEIFARRAKSREAKIQVELAQLKYRSTRLLGLGSILSRTGGGIGTRGPGEKKLEIDRRKIRENIYDLNKELEKIRKTRAVQREKRNKANMPKISLVGYTNAGKSTLRNTLAEMLSPEEGLQKEKVFEANMLFATLDVTTRAITLPDKRIASLTDTVGFVRKLPHDLVEAFKSTLEEVIFSDLLLHVVDTTSSYVFEQISAVENVLKELGAHDKETILVLNKVDVADKDVIEEIKSAYKDMLIVEISAKERFNLDILLNYIIEKIPTSLRKVELLIPYTETQVSAYLHRTSVIESEEYEEDGCKIVATVDDEVYNRIQNYVLATIDK
ncbi:MAG: GTPase HflX [Clostridiaceae bacterium]